MALADTPGTWPLGWAPAALELVGLGKPAEKLLVELRLVGEIDRVSVERAADPLAPEDAGVLQLAVEHEADSEAVPPRARAGEVCPPREIDSGLDGIDPGAAEPLELVDEAGDDPVGPPPACPLSGSRRSGSHTSATGSSV